MDGQKTALIEAIRRLQLLYLLRWPAEWFGKDFAFQEAEHDEYRETLKHFQKDYRRFQLQVEAAQQHLLNVAKESGFDVPTAWLTVRYCPVVERVEHHREANKPAGQILTTIKRSAPDGAALKAVREEMRVAQMRLKVEQSAADCPAALPKANKPQGGGPRSEPEWPSKEALALAVLADHPDWSDTQIAKKAGCNRTTLYTFKKFMAAREILREGKNDLPRGSKFPDEGMEAWENEDDN